jgi:hypothetical protein
MHITRLVLHTKCALTNSASHCLTVDSHTGNDLVLHTKAVAQDPEVTALDVTGAS